MTAGAGAATALTISFVSFASLATVAGFAPRPAAAATKPAAAKPAPSVTATVKAPPPPGAILKDRIAAVVDEDPILGSDIARDAGLGLEARKAGETDDAYHRRILSLLIDQRLRFHEIDRFGFVQVPADQVEKNLAEIRGRFPDAAAYQRRLKELGISESGVKQLVTRELMVLTYVDERLGPRVFVSLDDIKAYYRATLTPELAKQHQPLPPLDDVRESIRQVLHEQRLNQEIDRWTDELRDKANVANYYDQGGRPLPPVVKTIGPKKPG